MEGSDIPTLAAAVEIIDRPGVNGTANRINALKAAEITKYTTEGVASLAAANAAADTYAALKGTHVTVVDDLGRSVGLVLVVDVRVVDKQAITTSDPAGITHMVKAVWMLKPTQ